jgi:hypothetical protein
VRWRAFSKAIGIQLTGPSRRAFHKAGAALAEQI